MIRTLVDKDRQIASLKEEIVEKGCKIASLKEEKTNYPIRLNNPKNKPYKNRQKHDFITEKFILIGFAAVIFAGAWAYTKLRK